MFTGTQLRRFWWSASRWLSLALRCGLILCAWQGPIPWCHAHAAQDRQPALEGWFARHYQTRHLGLSEALCANLGWHVHLDSPWDDAGEHHGEERQSAPPPRLPSELGSSLRGVCTAGEWFAPARGTSDFLVWSVCVNEDASTSRRTPLTPHHFWEGFAPSLALPVRLGVIRS